MPKTLWNEDDRLAIAARVRQLTPDARPLWGSFDAPQMVCHITDTLRWATGEVRCEPKRSFLTYPVIKTLVMFHLPWPKGVPTAPELIARRPEDWQSEVQRFLMAMDTFKQKPIEGRWPEHVAFGRLSGAQWGRLLYRHTDHHLTQFGR
jgi:Protein of unknown function (DUF1569)